MRRLFQCFVCCIAVMISLTLAGCSHKTIPFQPPSLQSYKQVWQEHYDEVVFRLEKYHIQVEHVGQTMRIIIPSDYLFNWGSANLNYTTHDGLHEVVKLMRMFNLVTVTVKSYTDSLGPVERNLALSQARAKKIEDFLWREHADARVIYAKGYGAKQPIASNATMKGRATNRRVEIHFKYTHIQLLPGDDTVTYNRKPR